MRRKNLMRSHACVWNKWLFTTFSIFTTAMSTSTLSRVWMPLWSLALFEYLSMGNMHSKLFLVLLFEFSSRTNQLINCPQMFWTAWMDSLEGQYHSYIFTFSPHNLFNIVFKYFTSLTPTKYLLKLIFQITFVLQKFQTSFISFYLTKFNSVLKFCPNL